MKVQHLNHKFKLSYEIHYVRQCILIIALCKIVKKRYTNVYQSEIHYIITFIRGNISIVIQRHYIVVIL